MKDLEFIRYLINLIDEKPQDKEGSSPSDHHLHPVNQQPYATGPDPRDIKNAMDRDDIFIPPLQQRIEMLKKLTGVEPHDKVIMSHIDGDDVTAS